MKHSSTIAVAKQKMKKAYEHFVPAVPIDSGWPHNYSFQLVTDMNMLQEIFKPHVGGDIAFDLETSGLDPENSFIVGVALSFDGRTGYYVPINHFNDIYNLGREGMDIIYENLQKASKVFVYNAKFEYRMMEYYGYDKTNKKRLDPIIYDMSKVQVFDVSIPCHYTDTNVKMPSLKDSSLRFLGIKQQSFEEVSDGVTNFYYVDPEPATFYASSDAICTYLLMSRLFGYFQEGGLSTKIDNKAIYPLYHCEDEKIYLDGSLVNTLERDSYERVVELEESLVKVVGHRYNLNSPMQVATMLESVGVDTGKRTSTGFMSTSIPILEKLPNMDDNPVLKSYVEYKRVFKGLSSYIKPLKNEYSERGFVRCHYKTQDVPTGRLASGKDRKNSFFSKLNIQSIPKPHPAYYHVVRVGDSNLFDKEESILFGHKFILKRDGDTVKQDYGDKYLGVAEGATDDLNIRKCFLPILDRDSSPSEWVWLSIDYSAQELRIPANLSREPVWVEAFATGKDVHKETAVKLMGEENYDKEARKKAKGANFGVLYGMTSDSLAERFSMSKAEGDEFYFKYKNALPVLFAWARRVANKGRRDGTVYNYFGRPRRIRHYVKNDQIGFANRTAVNNTVQGTASDILKIALIKLWNRVLNHGDHRDYIRFLSTVHDEVNFGVNVEGIEERTLLCMEQMRYKAEEWVVTIDVEASFGWTWGSIFEFSYGERGFVPKYES